MLLARIYEAQPLSYPICHSQMRIIAFIDDPGTVGKIHIGESTQPPRIASARGPPLWEAAAAEQLKNDPRWGSSAQSAPESEFDQRIAWQVEGMLAPDTWGAASRGYSPGISPCLGCDSAGLSANRDACRPESGD